MSKLASYPFPTSGHFLCTYLTVDFPSTISPLITLPRGLPFAFRHVIAHILTLFSLEFKEIRKEWKARKKEEESQRKAAEERERAAAQAAQAGQVDAPGSSDPSQGGQPPAYGSGVRPQLPPIGYQPADGQVNGQYGGPGGGMVYQSNGQMGYPPNYPHSPYQSGPVYQQRE